MAEYPNPKTIRLSDSLKDEVEKAVNNEIKKKNTYPFSKQDVLRQILILGIKELEKTAANNE